MNSTTPFFSIIIPMFNTEKYIGECLDSIMMQNFSDYEVIVVDDGSTDGSCEIVSRYIKGKLNINLLKQKNSGVSAARNLGIEKARGKYIIFVDSDDFLVNESLEFLKNTLLENNDLDMLFFNYYEVGSKKMNKHIFRPQFLGKKISENTAIQGLLTKEILKGKLKSLCINDGENIMDIASYQERLIRVLDRKFPTKGMNEE